jgi:hypothetical protein
MLKRLAATDFARWLPAPAALLATGIALRLAGLLSSSIWYDESFSLALVRLPLLDMVRLAATDFNPPLWELLTWPVVRLIGYNALGLRSLAVMAGCAGLYLTYRLTAGYTKGQAVYTMALAALLPGLLWISQDGRVYAIYSLLYLAGYVYATQGRWLGLTAVSGLLLYAHGTGAFYVMTLLLIAWVYYPEERRKVILSGLLALLAWLPWMPSLLAASGDALWLKFDWQFLIVQSVGALFGPTLSGQFSALAVFVLAASVIGAVVFWLAKLFKYKSLKLSQPGLVILAVVPVVTMILISAIFKPLFFYRPLAPAILPLCLMIGLYLTPRRLALSAWILFYSWILVLAVGLLAWNTTTRGGGIEQAAALINSGYKSGELVYHATGTSYLPFDHYLDDDIPQMIMDIPQAAALLRPELATAFGGQYGELQDDQAAWVVYARDPVINGVGTRYMDDLTSNARARLVMVVHGWQFADIEIYYREGHE